MLIIYDLLEEINARSLQKTIS